MRLYLTVSVKDSKLTHVQPSDTEVSSSLTELLYYMELDSIAISIIIIMEDMLSMII